VSTETAIVIAAILDPAITLFISEFFRYRYVKKEQGERFFYEVYPKTKSSREHKYSLTSHTTLPDVLKNTFQMNIAGINLSEVNAQIKNYSRSNSPVNLPQKFLYPLDSRRIRGRRFQRADRPGRAIRARD
jgi:hypothetical protein